MKLDQPMFLAREIASLLDSDPIACAQVKEHLSVERICDLFAIENPQAEPESVSDVVNDSPYSYEEFLEFIVRQFSKAELLAAKAKVS